jgi:hypothetical protein
MKKLLCFFFFVNISIIAPLLLNKQVNETCIMAQNRPSDGWVKLGQIEAFDDYGISSNFILFVKVVQGAKFYKIRTIDVIPKEYTVIKESKTIKGVMYNYKAGMYYLNLPE